MSGLVGNPFLLTSAGAAGYQISRSLRFNSADSAFLSRTPASAGNRKTWTWSGWVKRAAGFTPFYGHIALFSGGTVTGRLAITLFNDTLAVDNSGVGSRATTAVFRDYSAWYHIVVAFDTTNATASDRIKFYINGVQQVVGTTTFTPALNTDYAIGLTEAHNIGRFSSEQDGYFSGYLADIHFIDGQALTPSSFAETNATTGQWVPKAYSGSYGTNGFRLDFSNPVDLGNDAAGANDWTPNNLSGVSGGPTSVAAASGALPIYNTTDTYGGVTGSGLRTDANASALSLCIPMGTASGLSITDEQPTGRVNSTVILTNTGVSSSTSFSKFYGGSASFNGTSSRLSGSATSNHAFGTGDFTVEGWFYQTADTGYPSALEIGNHVGTSGILFITRTGGLATIYSGGFYGAAPVALNTWTHIAWVRVSGVLRIYTNGVLVSSTSFTNNLTDITGGLTIGHSHSIATSSYYFPGYIQDLRIYKGVAKYTNNFNPPSSTQNPTIAAGFDSLVDTPTSYGTDTGAGGEVRGNYCTWNPLDSLSGNAFSNGNLDLVTSSSNYGTVRGTISVSSGKWYWEVTKTAGAAEVAIGIIKSSASLPSYVYATADGYSYNGNWNGNKGNAASTSSYGANYNDNDVIGVALDLDAGTLTFYKNGVSQGTAFTGLSGSFSPALSDVATSTTAAFVTNFGQRPFAYTAPSGFKALCDTNLPTPVVAKPSTVMDVKLYTGNGSTQTISGLGFSPDLVWCKDRVSNTTWHGLFDIVRGNTKVLSSNRTEAELTYTDEITSFNSDGFSLGVGVQGYTNTSGNAYVAWTWGAGSSTVTNTQGSITSQVRANASAGFSIVTYTAGASGSTVGHGLGVAPGLIITKSRTSTGSNWPVYHSSLGGSRALELVSTSAAVSLTNYWGNPNSTTFGLYNNSTGNNIGDMVAYCFAPVAGYSSFGSYTGNGSTDGPFVYTGFRPRWILVKRSDSIGNWYVLDAARNTYNVVNSFLIPNNSAADQTFTFADFTSNGFKLRDTSADWNANGGTILYAAFAENPFQYARAR